MIIITQKLHPRRLVAGCALFALALGVLGAGLGLVRDIQSAAAVADLQVDPRGIKTNADRVAFLEGYGWIVSQEPAAVEDIRLPDTFDASYDEYLSLQKSQGFDLSQYAGKTVKRYTYQVSNYPGLQENIWASLLLYKKEVIGGEIYSNEGDGFIQALPYPAKTRTGPPRTQRQRRPPLSHGGRRFCTAFSWRRAAAPARRGRPAGPRPRRIGRPGRCCPPGRAPRRAGPGFPP